MSAAALEAVRLSKRYRSAWALADCTMAVPAGRLAALVGPNGAGKTTLLQIAAGLIKPTSGEMRVLGSAPRQDPAWLAQVGFLAQDVPLYRRLSTEELLGMGARSNPGWDDMLARARLRALGLPFDRRVGELSGGERAQVALALALAKRPRLLLLDEPVASLDPLARMEFLGSLAGAVAESDVTVVLSSHLVADLERVCDYLVVLARATVQVDGDIDELLAAHRILIGPRRSADVVAAGHAVVSERHSERQSTLLVRTAGPVFDPSWTVNEVSLEELVLAYMGRRDGLTAAPPRPSRLSAVEARS